MSRFSAYMVILMFVAAVSGELRAESRSANTRITGVDARKDGRVIIKLAQEFPGMAACANTADPKNRNRLATTNDGILRVAIAALLSGRSVAVVGDDVCSVVPGTLEDVLLLELKDS
ncbi:MAG: hypothetical protein AAFQ65_06150 [Myxococcota bacterium]